MDSGFPVPAGPSLVMANISSPIGKLGDDRTHAAGTSPKSDSKRTTGTPRPWTFTTVRAGLLACGSSRLSRLPGENPPVAWSDSSSPFTVAGAAPVLALLSEHRTGFPLSLRAALTRKTLTTPEWRGQGDKSMARKPPATGWTQAGPRPEDGAGNFFPPRPFGIFLLLASARPVRGACDSPKPQMRVDAAPSGHVDMLQVSVLTAKKCRFHAPRGQDADQRVA